VLLQPAAEFSFPFGIGGAPCLSCGRDESIFRSIRHLGGPVFLVEPADLHIAMPLDLPREVVADGPGTLDLAPHTGGNFDLLREGLVQPLGWQARGNGALEKAAMQRKDIATARDGDIGHCSKTTTTRQEKIVPVVDVAVNTIYSPSLAAQAVPFFQPLTADSGNF
jgi:predicted Rdx family selenoprotein